MDARDFEPHPLLRSGHAMTIAGAYWPRRTGRVGRAVTRRVIPVEPGVGLVVLVDEPKLAARGTVVLVHGLTGCANAGYMRGTSEKALAAGFRSVRVNLRGAGGTEVEAPTLYHSGMSRDLELVLEDLALLHPGPQFVVGFSLGGNIVMKLAGEWGDTPPSRVRSVAAISPPLDLADCANALDRGGVNRIYQSRFVRALRDELLRRASVQPRGLALERLDRVRSVRDFDDFFTAPYFGFDGARDYYARCSALRVIDRVRVPSLVISAADDPLVPPGPLYAPALIGNPAVKLVLTQHGGHLGFIGRRERLAGALAGDLDRHWAEHRVVEFFGAVHDRCDDVAIASSR